MRGLPTAHSAAPLNEEIDSHEDYVWPYAHGHVRGHGIIPLYATVPEAALEDEKFYALMALTDALRVGRTREKNLAIQKLKKLIC